LKKQPYLASIRRKFIPIKIWCDRLHARLESALDRGAQVLGDIIYERYVGQKPLRPVRIILRVLSWGYKSIIKTRNFLYEKRILHDHPLGCAVIVVGNLTVGGTGKTPIVEMLAKQLTEQGRRVAILSRGYKSRAEPLYRKAWYWLTHKQCEPPKVVSDGTSILLSSLEAGDEPFMLAQNLPGVVVLVDKNRVKAGHYAVERFGADTLILDDGFQYRTLRGRLNFLLIDQSNPFGNGRLLPRGILREPIRGLRRASCIFLTKCTNKWPSKLEERIREINPNAKLIACTHQPRYLQSFSDATQISLEKLRGKKIGALSGIAVPESFEHLLSELGATIVYNGRFLDHHRFSDEELENAFHKARNAGAEWMLTTEKDAVRLSRTFAYSMEIYFVRMEIGLLRGQEHLQESLSTLMFNKIPARGSAVLKDTPRSASGLEELNLLKK
jgi:tetraacyldisaccharide 4'-kinase